MIGRPGGPTKKRKNGGCLNATTATSTSKKGTHLYICNVSTSKLNLD